MGGWWLARRRRRWWQVGGLGGLCCTAAQWHDAVQVCRFSACAGSQCRFSACAGSQCRFSCCCLVYVVAWCALHGRAALTVAALPPAAEPLRVGGVLRWVLKDVIGREEGLGVECLSGSAAIGTTFCRWGG
jgi:hypothetical protein